jgi:hypothetical protein
MPTLRRRNSDPGAGARAPLRSSLASAAWAVEDRVVWGAADVFRGLVEVVKWPFERIAWAVEHWLVWPIQEETALWSRPVRAAVLAGVVLLAGAGVAAGIVTSRPSGGSDSSAPVAFRVSAPAAPVAARDKAAAAVAGPVLHGSTEIVPSEHGGGVTKAEAATEPPATHAAAEPAAAAAGVTAESAGSAEATSGSAGATSGSDVAGPAAIAVAKKFSGAFVLYETGHDTPAVKAIFHETATPDLAQALLKRPPRLPANVKVPEAKVLNIVAGPKHGDTYTLSVSLLRVGVTSELRLDMQKAPSGKTSSKRPEWQVTDVLG